MDSDDDYGDLDDTAFLEAATQYDAAAPFQSLPRPPPAKRRKIDHSNERTPSIPPRPPQQTTRPRGPFADSDSDDDDDAFEPVSLAKRRTSAKKPSPASSEEFEDASGAETPRKQRTGRGRQSKSIEKERGENGRDSESPWKKLTAKTKKDRIHTPTTVVDMADVYFTQPPQEYSPPWKTRGAIWTKASVSIGIHKPSAPSEKEESRPGIVSAKTPAIPSRQSVSSRPKPRSPSPEYGFDSPIELDDVENGAPDDTVAPQQPSFPADPSTEAYDPALELADLPSDAFESSSSSPRKQDDDVVLVSEKRTRLVGPQTGLRQTTLFGGVGGDDVPASQANKRYNFVASQKDEPLTHHKLDREAMKTWVYPINLGTIRDYQFNIVARGLFHNLLVALPTGLGKTFIAATVMLNWYRWTTEAQIVFMAPSRPLVSQQVEACLGIAGIPRSQTSMLTGGAKPGLRAEEWKSKRVFFMTPQTLINDLKTGISDPKKIVLLVVDEAHKATGSYAYTEVVSFMRRFNPSYRILALTATPGSDVESVQKVIDGLNISRIEIRTEKSMDISKYVHQRKVEKKVFENSDEMTMCMDLYSEALQPLVNKLNGLNAYWSKDPLMLTPYGCTQSRQKYFADVGRGANQGVKMMVSTIFQTLASISQGMELLKYHGIRPFYVKMREFRDSTAEGKSKYKKEICNSDGFKKLLARLQAWALNDDFVGHPKLEYLIQVILQHFSDAAEGRNPDGAAPSQTRIMVFAHWRDSAEEIVRVLKKHEPMIRPRVFVGQSSAKNSEGMQQKDQTKAIDDFKAGIFNTLVATSIGEEGLDIGEVDLIVCYDSKASPIRMLQRMGRTGRKREGKIILLQMRGKEETDAAKAKDSYEKMQELIAKGTSFAFHDDVSRRILPREAQPVVDKRVVEIPLENSQTSVLPEPKKNGRIPKRPPKKFHMPDNVITGFVTAGRMGEEITSKPRGRKPAAAPVYPSDEIYTIPSLDSVLLDDKQSQDLERRFQTVFDDDDQPIVGAVDMCKHPARQRILPRTKYFKQAGKVTKRVVETLQRMHTIDVEQIERFRRAQLSSGHETSPCPIIVPDNCTSPTAGEMIDEDGWASDDPASQPILSKVTKPRAKPGPKPKAKTAVKETTKTTTPKTPARRGRPPKNASSKVQKQTSPDEMSETPRYRASDLVEEGVESSPPPTDPRMRLASQAIDLGSDDTIGEEEVQDTQAYRLDSDLRDFIAEDDEESVDVPESSLPTLDFNGLGHGTQAVLNGAKARRPKKMDKIFTSDPTDDDAIVTSDSEDDVPIGKAVPKGRLAHRASTADSASNDESDDNDEPVVQARTRTRRVIDDDSDDE